MSLLEAEVHAQLRGFLRSLTDIPAQPLWTHHLTMARLVSRTLRLQRSALIQTESTVSRYAYSYLTPALLSDEPVLLVVPEAVQQRLLTVEIPQLQQWLETNKPIKTGNPFTESGFKGLGITSPQAWLSDRLRQSSAESFPPIPTLIDQAETLEQWVQSLLTVTLTSQDWEQLMQDYPQHQDLIREVRIRLTQAIYSHPPNPYENYLLEASELEILNHLWQTLATDGALEKPFAQFGQPETEDNRLICASVAREKGNFSLSIRPIDVSGYLRDIWQQQPIVLMGGFFDDHKTANLYRNTIGLQDKDILCLKFAPNRQNEYIYLYLPDRLPLPNTPQFQGMLQEQLHRLIALHPLCKAPIVIIIEDVPLKGQMGAILAAQWGSRVKVEKTTLNNNDILVCGWAFWQQYHQTLPLPHLFIVATLPLPSLENPLVAGQVAYYKQKRQDWFRHYLLPTALKTLQQAIIPLRESQGMVALLDNRVNYRSYGSRILATLEPYAKINYLDEFVVNGYSN